jgi:site-specific DNA-cytosine methylase
MKEFTYVTLFGGAGIGTSRLKELGGRCLANVEKDPEQFDVWAKNNPPGCFDKATCILTTLVPTHLKDVDVLQASPPCINFSSAKSISLITDEDRFLDLALTDRVVSWTKTLMPKLLIVENVPAYFKGVAFEGLKKSIKSLGYLWDALEFREGTDYGLPIIRKRGFYIARLESAPVLRSSSYQTTPCSWLSLIKHDVEIEKKPPTKWQQELLKEIDKEESRVFILQRLGMSKKNNRVYWENKTLPAIKASLADDGNKGRGRSSIWTYFDLLTNQTYNLKPRAFANLMGIPRDFQISDNPRIALRSIGNGIIPAIINDLVWLYL